LSRDPSNKQNISSFTANDLTFYTQTFRHQGIYILIKSMTNLE